MHHPFAAAPPSSPSARAAFFRGRLLRAAPLLGACAVAAALGVGCQAAPAPEGRAGTTSQAIQGGSVDATHKFTVGICASNSQSFGNCAGICTGTLILPNLVVTARHCVEDSTEFSVNGGEPGVDCARSRFTGQSHNYFHVTTNTTMGNAQQGWFRTKQVIVTPGTAFCGNDLAFLVLDGAGVPSSVATPAAPGTRYDMTDATQYGLSMAAIGYGITSPSANDSGTRRARRPIDILCTPGDARRDCGDLRTGQLAGVITEKEFVAGDGPCKGDSGSGAFEDFNFQFGKFVSFGVLSRGGESEDGRTCSLSFYTRLDAWRDLVVQAAQTASNNWTLYPKPNPDWTVYSPPAPPTSRDAGPGTTKAGAGEPCASDDACASGRCLDAGDGTLVCAATCAEDGACGEGLVCDGNACVPAASGEEEETGGSTTRGPKTAAAPAEAPTAQVPSGCAAAPDPTKPVPWRGLGVGLGLAVAAAARRRRRT